MNNEIKLSRVIFKIWNIIIKISIATDTNFISISKIIKRNLLKKYIENEIIQEVTNILCDVGDTTQLLHYSGYPWIQTVSK